MSPTRKLPTKKNATTKTKVRKPTTTNSSMNTPSRRRTSVTSLFTTKQLQDSCKDSLMAVEVRRDGGAFWEFVCTFKDRTGIVSGGYLKSSKEIVSITIFGKGTTWQTVVSTAISLHAQDDITARDIQTKLGLSKTENKTLEHNGTKFTLLRFDDGQQALKFRPAVDAKTAAKLSGDGQPRLMVAVALPFVRASSIGKPTQQRGLATSGAFKTLNVAMTTFTKRFNTCMKQNISQTKLDPPKKHSAGYTFAGGTHLLVFAGDGKNVSQILLNGNKRDSVAFWLSLECTIASLQPRLTASDRADILTKLGKKKTNNALPPNDTEWDDGKMYCTYAYRDTDCVLQIWPSRARG